MRTGSKGSTSKKKIFIIILILVLVIAVAAIFLLQKDKAVAPPTNPLTGEVIKNEDDLPARPVIVSVDNSPQARPQSGVSKADIVYEFPAEGNIPRLEPIFYSTFPDRVAPVRSARPAFVDLSREYKAIFTAFGASPQAKEYLAEKVVPFVDPFVSGHGDDQKFFWRDTKARGAGEHNVYVDTQKVYDGGSEKSWHEKQKVRSFPRYTGKETEEYFANIPKANEITLKYVSENIKYTYDDSESGKNLYTRYVDGKVAIDSENDSTLTVSNVIIQFAEIGKLDAKRLDIDLTKGGKCIIFTKGMAFEGQWSRADLDSPTKFYTVEKDKDGKDVKKQIKLSVGKTWVQVLDQAETVNY